MGNAHNNNTLVGMESDVKKINEDIDIEVESFLKKFFGLYRTVVDGKVVTKIINRKEGALILLWKNDKGHKYGPYWNRCHRHLYKKKDKDTGEIIETERWTYKHVKGNRLTEQEKFRFYDEQGAKEAFERKQIRDGKIKPKVEPVVKPNGALTPEEKAYRKIKKEQDQEAYDERALRRIMFIRDKTNWEEYEKYDIQVQKLRNKRRKLTNAITNIKISQSKSGIKYKKKAVPAIEDVYAYN